MCDNCTRRYGYPSKYGCSASRVDAELRWRGALFEIARGLSDPAVFAMRVLHGAEDPMASAYWPSVSEHIERAKKGA